MNNNVAVIDLNEYKYEKFSNEGISLKDDIVYNRHSNRTNKLNKEEIERELTKGYIKLLTANIKCS